MKQKLLSLKKLTRDKWINLFESVFTNSRGRKIKWSFASRKENPIVDQSADVVVIVPIIDTPNGKEVVLVKEYRVAAGGIVYAFPAGLIEPDQRISEAVEKELKEETGLDVKEYIRVTCPLYSCVGLSDETAIIVFVKAEGEISTKYQEADEDIQVITLNWREVVNFVDGSKRKLGAKAWTILYHYSQIGRIE